EALARELWPQGRPSGGETVALPLGEYLDGGADATAGALGFLASRLLIEGLSRLRAACPALAKAGCRVVAPAVEGVGRYPELPAGLRAAPYPVWVAGDATGVFRGLTAALVSGYYAGLRALGERGA